MAIFILGLVNSCAQKQKEFPAKDAVIVTNKERRFVFKALYISQISNNTIEVVLFPGSDGDYAKIKSGLGLSSDDVKFARGEVQLVLDKNNRVIDQKGCFEVRVGYHWQYYPEVRKVPAMKDSKKLTNEIIRRLSEKRLL